MWSKELKKKNKRLSDIPMPSSTFPLPQPPLPSLQQPPQTSAIPTIINSMNQSYMNNIYSHHHHPHPPPPHHLHHQHHHNLINTNNLLNIKNLNVICTFN
jgi:hypothetical protein